MNRKDNQRTRLSKLLLRNAMLDLLKEKKTVNRITVRELCERAELTRSTFYAHYSEPRERFDALAEQLLGDVAAYMKQIGASRDAGAYGKITEFVRYIRRNDLEFRTLLAESADADFKSRFMQISANELIRSFDITLRPAQEQYVYSYILNGSMSVIIQWIRSGYEIDEESLVGLLFSMNKSLLAGVAG